jgi:hypothetical protein
MKRLIRLFVVAAIAAGWLVAAPPAVAHAEENSSCELGNGIKHVITITFDNTHFTRDNPNVPSDLEQMPHLLNFIKSSGTLLTNYHTPLISHTATDILTSLTGVYGDRHGVPVSNTYRYYKPDGSDTSLGVAFAYWTAPIFDPTLPPGAPPINTKPNMLTADGKNAPAPWVPFTRAGCDFGAVSTANIVLENVGIDIPTVFGPASPESQQVAADKDQAFADYVGIAVHCAQGSGMCSTANNGKPDLLPDEPGGYASFNGLFGHKYVAPQISPTGPLTDLNGNVIKDSKGRIGFPGFDDMPAATTLGYVAAMQEHGVPVTYAYISDAHDKHTSPTRPYGPGEAGYVQTLREYDDAFDKFFTRLAAHGINTSNTLFAITSDEGDHFAGGAPSPEDCDGVTTPCTYPVIGAIHVNTTGLLKAQTGVTTPFRMHVDVAPTFYLKGNPGRTDPITRAFGQGLGQLEVPNQYTGETERLTQALADPVGMKLLHMISGDPSRTPTVTMFAHPDFWMEDGSRAPACPPCYEVRPRAWIHGTYSPDITTTWLGLAGPGVKVQGETAKYWADHADLRPTILSLVRLTDDYASQGRVMFENFTSDVVPEALQASRGTALELGQLYKQINAPVGELGLNSLVVSTLAIKGDAETYDALSTRLADITTRRDALANKIASMLEGAAFRDASFDSDAARRYFAQAKALLAEMRDLAEQ